MPWCVARGIGLFDVSASDGPDIAGRGCKARCLQREEQRTRASHQTLGIPLSVSGSEGNFEVSFVALPGGLDTVLILFRFGERWSESSQNNAIYLRRLCR